MSSISFSLNNSIYGHLIHLNELGLVLTRGSMTCITVVSELTISRKAIVMLDWNELRLVSLSELGHFSDGVIIAMLVLDLY